ncbi:MAG: hypothetical protein AB8B61_00555 [Cyclobacteriaceae bacterium]
MLGAGNHLHKMILLGKLGIKAVESAITGEDKLGLKSAYDVVKEVLSEVKKEWEDEAAYKARQKVAREYRTKMQAYEKAFNAAHYHTGQAKTIGYISAEALQFVFGRGIFKEGAQGVKAAGRGAKGVLEMKKISEYAKKIPKNWIKQPANKGVGIKYVNPKNPGDYVRFSPPNLDSRAPAGQRAPYFQRFKDGKALTKDGKWIIDPSHYPDKDVFHLPQAMFGSIESLLDF